jgi:N-acetylglucosaminyldiphosphoundecaprenol N-acetyl-beta-D-mannosaminyltransferase
MRVRHRILNVDIDAVSLEDAVHACEQAIEHQTPIVIGCVNAAKLVNMQRDAALRDAVNASDLIIADGMAVVWASRLLKRPLPERVPGIDLFVRLLQEAAVRGQSVYLLGARQEVVEEVVRRVERDYPGLTIAGYRNGYFSDAELPAILDDIRGSGADMLFLGITPPKKELFLARWGKDVSVSVAHGVGGAFDVLAGRVPRAPALFQRFGMEWLFRVIQEPRRMWKRYLVTNTGFILMLLRELMRGSKAS